MRKNSNNVFQSFSEISVSEALVWAKSFSLEDESLWSFEIELLLSEVTGISRESLYAWPNRVLKSEQRAIFAESVERMKAGEPLAYVIGFCEFWSLKFQVNPSVLIPRPDTELIVEAALALPSSDNEHIEVLDLGTGSGAVGLSLAYEKPSWQITGIDNSSAALAVAAENANALGLHNVRLLERDWYKKIPLPSQSSEGYQIILANPPYLSKDDNHLSGLGLSYEPIHALVSENNGLADLYRIITIAKNLLDLDGWLLLEHGYNQRVAVENFFLESGFVDVKCLRDVAGNARVSMGRNA